MDSKRQRSIPETNKGLMTHTKILLFLLQLRGIGLLDTAWTRSKLYRGFAVIMRSALVATVALRIWSTILLLKTSMKTNNYRDFLLMFSDTSVIAALTMHELLLVKRRRALLVFLLGLDRLCSALLDKSKSFRIVFWAALTINAFFMAFDIVGVYNGSEILVDHDGNVFNETDTTKVPLWLMLRGTQIWTMTLYVAQLNYITSICYLCYTIQLMLSELPLRGLILVHSTKDDDNAEAMLPTRSSVDRAALTYLNWHEDIVGTVLIGKSVVGEYLGSQMFLGWVMMTLHIRSIGFRLEETGEESELLFLQRLINLLSIAFFTYLLLASVVVVNNKIRTAIKFLASEMDCSRPSRRSWPKTSRKVNDTVLDYLLCMQTKPPYMKILDIADVNNDIYLTSVMVILSYTCVMYGF